MDERSLRVLEFYKVRELIKKYAHTKGGKEKIDNLMPYNNVHEINNKLEETEEALEILITKGKPPLQGLYDIHEHIQRARKGGVLLPEALLKIGIMLRTARLMKEFFRREEEEKPFPRLEDLAYILMPIKPLEDEIERCIISEDEISDKASQTLYNIRRSIREKNSSLREKVNSIVKANSKYLQDELYTMRGDRYVIPVRAEYKGAVPGLIHDQSSTGATVFIEPMSLVNLNNEIRELKLKEKAEIERILTAMSVKVKENSSVCLSNLNTLIEFDFIFAKAAYGSKLNCVKPKIREDGIFNILGARHPLIETDKVIPSDINLGDDFKVLMITGPNTGGKTVTIKTAGLLHIMALSGLLIPAKDNSEVAFFTDIFAEIGDEQSIEQSLSTFSSHMTNIIRILKKADSKSFVIFDEIGSGTDPSEGSALAISVIETLKERGCRIIVTTHYSDLKAYALKTEEIENASVEFDIKTLKPTYRLLIGIPGKSNAFEISKRLGLDDYIIAKAREHMSNDNLQFEGLIRELQEKSIVAKKEARDALLIRREAEELKKKYEEKLKRLEVTRDRAYMDARREAKEIIANAKDEADEILKAMRELEKMGIEGGGRARLEEERKKLKNSLEKRENNLNNIKENEGEPIKEIKLGMEAFLPSLNQKVIIISMPDSKGEVQAEAGIMKINVKVKDLRRSKETRAEKVKRKREVKLNITNIESRVDLRGLDAEEACYKADKYLDDAYRANLGEVTIVHGKGTGILRKAINDMLKKHPHVKSYRLGVYGEGGDGVTVAVLK